MYPLRLTHALRGGPLANSLSISAMALRPKPNLTSNKFKPLSRRMSKLLLEQIRQLPVSDSITSKASHRILLHHGRV
jgi:hypothetical protein